MVNHLSAVVSSVLALIVAMVAWTLTPVVAIVPAALLETVPSAPIAIDPSNIIDLIVSQGFAIAVAAYLLLRLEQRLTELRDSVRELVTRLDARSPS